MLRNTYIVFASIRTSKYGNTRYIEHFTFKYCFVCVFHTTILQYLMILIDCILPCFCSDPTAGAFSILLGSCTFGRFPGLLSHNFYLMLYLACKACKCRCVLNENVYTQMYKRKEHTAKWSYPLLAEST